MRTLLSHKARQIEVIEMLLTDNAALLLRFIFIFCNSLDEMLIDECVNFISTILEISHEKLWNALYGQCRLVESIAVVFSSLLHRSDYVNNWYYISSQL